MPQRGQGDALDVVRRDVVAPIEEGHRSGAPHERQGAARAAAHRDARPLTRPSHYAHGIVDHLSVNPLLGGKPLKRRDREPVETRLHLRQRQFVAGLACGGSGDDGRLLGARRIADLDLEQEPVELRLGQRVRSFGFDGILRGEHHERLRQWVGLPFERHLVFLHRFEQRALRFRRSAIDFVGQQHVREYRAAYEPQLTS